MTNVHKLTIGVFATALALGITITSSTAGTLESLERERSQFIKLMFDAEIGQVERQTKIESMRVRLIDLERMVLRDDSLKGKTTPIIQRAFANYDLTFLAHAALEKEKNIVDNWLEQVGLTTDALMTAKHGGSALTQLDGN